MSRWAEGQDNYTRGRILDVTERLLYSQAPEGVAMESVARKAGISRAILYQHFSSRETLYAAVAVRIVSSLNKAIENRIFGTRGFRNVRASCLAVELFWQANPEKMAVLQKLRSLQVADPGDKNAQELIRLVRANQMTLAQAVKDGGGEGAFIAGIDPLATGQFFSMALHDARCLPPVHLPVLDRCGMRCEDFVKNCRDPVYRSLLTSPDN
ncbi:TetR/AcrR family transcriptional regulator [Methanocella arvoryzae]|uniref:Transcription regulator (TetR family) n=1 Tax=Methanocella arvoryzae (strain DSM 22066 / NBRC 105507 / MRE50) TaxID=351160 RepID=Q0W1S6_METAR|nr:TetR/AcrR family transcriptional regulator [Methanocella arvoryzae]CAJ37667.1 transcription regulator (TetR family) [Methanocella arvoryzae MRE50]